MHYRGSIVAVATFPADRSAVIKISITSARRQRPLPPRLQGTFAALVVAQHGGELVCMPESERAVAITFTLPTEPKRCDRPRPCLERARREALVATPE